MRMRRRLLRRQRAARQPLCDGAVSSRCRWWRDRPRRLLALVRGALWRFERLLLPFIRRHEQHGRRLLRQHARVPLPEHARPLGLPGHHGLQRVKVMRHAPAVWLALPALALCTWGAGCAAPVSAPRDSEPYLNDASFRRATLEASLVNRSNGYSRLRFEHYSTTRAAPAGWCERVWPTARPPSR
jgi:hypothetical protein